MKAVLEKNDAVLIESVETAYDFRARFLGLMGRPPLADGHAMYICPCESIHTFFMRFNLDLLFLDSELTVILIVRNVSIFRLVSGGSRADSVLEMTAGWLPVDAVEMGDTIRFQ